MSDSYRAHRAETSFQNIQGLIDRYGIERIGFLTLTTVKGLTWDELLRRFNSLRPVLVKVFTCGIRFVERSGKGRLHVHLVMVTREAIGGNCNWSSRVWRGHKVWHLRNPNGHLREVWAKLRAVLPKYGFGRHELLPVRTNAAGVARYVAAYTCKTTGPEDKGRRVVGYVGRVDRRDNGLWCWIDGRGREWRRGLGLFCTLKQTTPEALRAKHGAHWSFIVSPAVWGLASDPDTWRPIILGGIGPVEPDRVATDSTTSRAAYVGSRDRDTRPARALPVQGGGKAAGDGITEQAASDHTDRVFSDRFKRVGSK